MDRSRSFIATPPGATIKEQLISRGMSQKEFASRMDMSEKHISHLINGDVQLTKDVANRLELVLGIHSHFWNNLESIYREKLAKVEAENSMDEDLEIAKKYPYNEMAKNGWVANTRHQKERVCELRKFFEIVRLSLLTSKICPGIACRRQNITEKADYALLAWSQKAKLEARSIDVSPINIKLLQESSGEIRKMTTLSPEIFCPKLIDALSDCGIAIVFLPHIGGSFLHGATFYDKNKIVIGMTVRGKDADRFWFSLFHELGHIILGHINQPNGTSEYDEKKADEYARDQLIPLYLFDEFVKKGDFCKESIISFAKEIELDPGIVVGRLQKEHYIPYSWHNSLKIKYSLSK